MAGSPIDYEALARRAGALISQPAGVDYTALAARAGALASKPAAMAPDAGAQGRESIQGRTLESMQLQDPYAFAPEDNRGFVEQAWEKLKSVPAGLAHIPRGLNEVSPTLTIADQQDLPIQTVAEADRLSQAGNYGGALGTVVGTAGGIVGTGLIIHGVAKGIGAGAAKVGRAVGRIPTPAGTLEPQLDAAEASAVRYGHEEGVKMPASVQSGSPAIAHAEKVLQHFPLASKVAKTARAAEQSTLAAAGAREVAGLGSPDAPAVPGAIDIGEAVHAKVDQLQADHAAAGAKLAGSAPAFLDAGESVNRASQSTVEAHGAAADNSYDLFRSIEEQPKFKARLQTGTRQIEAGLDEAGNPAYKTVPVYNDIQLPVDRRPAKLALKPVLARLERLMPEAQQAASPGLKALRNVVQGPDFESASITDEDLGALKGIVRDSGNARAVGLAEMAVKQLSKAVDSAAERAGPEAVAALKKGRASTVNKYNAIDFQKSLDWTDAGLPGASPGEPVGVASKILRPGDRSVNLLRSVAEHAPDQIPVLGDALAHDLVQQVKSGDAAGALNKWKGYGEATKGILYPEGEAPAGGGAKPPSKAAALGSYLERAAELENVKKSLPQSDALVSNIIGGGERGTNTLRTIAAHAPEHIPALAQRVVQDLIETGTAEAGMNKPQSVLRKWIDIGDEKKNILFRDPYPNTGGGPRVQRLTDFFVLMKKLGENPNPSGSGTIMAFVKGVGLVISTPLTGGAVLLASRKAAQMLFNPESSRWMMQALKTPATAKGAPLLAKQIINAAGPDTTPAPAAAATPATASTAGPIAPAAAPVQTSGGGGLNGQTTNTGSGESGTVRSETRTSAADGSRAAGGQKRSNVTTVELAGKPGQGYQARYVISELGDSTASHNGLNFEENPTYPYKNQRNYKTAVNQQKIIVGSSEAGHNPRLHVEPSADAVNGPPVEDARKNVLSGNGRHQMQERIYAAGGNAAKRLRDAIAEQARQIEGLNPDDAYTMKRPSLRLVIEDAEFQRRGPGSIQNFIADTNVAGTASLTAGEQMISDSRRVSDATVNHVGGLLEGIGPEATLSQALDGRAGAEVLNKLVDDGVIPDQSRASYVKETKLGDVLTEEGKERVTRLMVGRFFETPEQLSKLPEARNQVERIAAPLSQVDSIPDWSLTAKVQEAVGILERAHDVGEKDLEGFFKQDNMFGAAKYSAEAVDLARALKSAPAEVIKGAARQYAGDAAEASRGPSMFGEVSTPGDAFKAAFSPESLEKRAAELKALRDAARKPAAAPANALAQVTPAAAEPANALAPTKPRKPRSKK
jgi:hypothetical protein